MAELNFCPHCDQPVAIDDDACEHCAASLDESTTKDTPDPVVHNSLIFEEYQIPYLGEYLLQVGLIERSDLESALAIQEEQAKNGKRRLLGQILIEQGVVDQNSLNQIILEQLISLGSALENSEQTLDGLNKTQGLQTLGDDEPSLNGKDLTSKAIRYITRAGSKEQVLEGLAKVFQDAPYVSAILIEETMGYGVFKSSSDKAFPEIQNHLSLYPDRLEKYLNPRNPFLVFTMDDPPDLPGELLEFLDLLDAKYLAILPVVVDSQMLAMIICTSNQSQVINISNLKLHVDITKLFSRTLQGIVHAEIMHRRLSVMRSLDAINQTIAKETDLERLYQVIHQQISKVVGEVDMIIALYDRETESIHIPYACENKQPLSIPPFPLGEGLTSAIIKTGQPLMVVENAHRRAEEMGAKFVGKPAKSFLGVPLMVAGEVIGALIVQDTSSEFRFDDEDQNFLSILASQVAISIRNLVMLNDIQAIAERDRIVSEITSKFWTSSDVDTIMRTAILELSRTLKASKGLIQLNMPDTGAKKKDVEIV